MTGVKNFRRKLFSRIDLRFRVSDGGPRLRLEHRCVRFASLGATRISSRRKSGQGRLQHRHCCHRSERVPVWLPREDVAVQLEAGVNVTPFGPATERLGAAEIDAISFRLVLVNRSMLVRNWLFMS